MEEILDDLVGTGQIDRTVRVGEAERLFLVHVVLVIGLVVFDVATGSLIRQPLADVTFVRSGLGRQILG
ncbi:hypothetical protein [Gordonia rhizosphera]|uniref:hypothetical protein n=1 Tax=Gordonia rhizosphera TaxID=83341 RepID=UPI001FE08930|nr:hypothetical protein [Gordonia rhizosphera]